jgi:hypothetical protein
MGMTSEGTHPEGRGQIHDLITAELNAALPKLGLHDIMMLI